MFQNFQYSQLITLLKNRIQNIGFYSDIEYRQNLNEALSLVQITSLTWKSRFWVVTSPGLVFYDLTSLPGTLDSNGNPLILMPLRVAFNSNPLDFSSIADTDSSIIGWQNQTTDSDGAPDEPQFWGTLGLNQMYIWPADAAGNNSLAIDAAVRAPQMALDGSNDGDFVNMDSSMVGPLLDYAQHVCQQKRGTQQLSSTTDKVKNFMRLLAQSNSLFEASAIFKASYALQSDRKKRLAGDFSGRATPARYR